MAECNWLDPFPTPIIKSSELATSLSKNIKGVYSSNTGLQVDTQCAKLYGLNDFTGTIDRALNQGMACLSKLKGSKPKEHLKKLQLYKKNKKNPIKITCSDQTTNWSGISANAFASYDKSYSLQISKEKKLIHPYISINPNDQWSFKLHKLKRTFFHELMHTLGYKHGENIEFPTACADCCIIPEAGEEINYTVSNNFEKERLMACQICRGEYAGIADQKYIEDMLQWKKGKLDEKVGLRTLFIYFTKKPNDQWGRSRLEKYIQERSKTLASKFKIHLSGKGMDDLSPLSQLSLSLLQLSQNKRNNAAYTLSSIEEDDLTDSYAKQLLIDLKKNLKMEIVFYGKKIKKPSIFDQFK